MARHNPFQKMTERGGPLPRSGVIGESFRAGFYDIGHTRQGLPDSIQRKAYNAGRKRSKVEPDAFLKADERSGT